MSKIFIPSCVSFLILLFAFPSNSHSQTISSTKLEYTIQVDGLTDREQGTRIENDLKQKTGIIAEKLDFDSKTLVVTTTKDVTFSNICDVLLTERLKARDYTVKEE